jgi:hypothetical protein
VCKSDRERERQLRPRPIWGAPKRLRDAFGNIMSDEVVEPTSPYV